MNLRHIAYAIGATISSVSLIVACSSSSSGGGTTPTDAGKTDSGGGGNDSGGGGTDSGGGGTDGGGGGSCKLNDGTYTLDLKAMLGTDVDAASPFAAGCKDSSSMFSYPPDGGGSGFDPSCTTSTDGCMITCDLTQDNAGYKTETKITVTINADGNGYTGTSVSKTTEDDGGAVDNDCTYMMTATKQ
jgi:hypothetical protein